MSFWNTDQLLAMIRDDLDKARVQARRNTHHILHVMFRQHRETQAKLDKLLAIQTPALKAELIFGKPVDKPPVSQPPKATNFTQKPAVGGPPQRS